MVAVTPDGKFVYVTKDLNNIVSVIDTASNTVVATVPVGITPIGIAIGPSPACGPGDATLANIKFPAAGTMTFDVSSPARTLEAISLPGATNIGSYTLPKVASGGHGATGGVFIKTDSTKTATFELQAVFVSAAFACLIDPTTTTLRINNGHHAVQAFQAIPDSEHFVEIGNGDPGLRWLRIEVNGKYNRTLSLASDGTTRAYLSGAMNLGQNTLTFTGEGKTRSFANIYVSDSAPGKPALAGGREAGIWGHLMFEKDAP
jgi:YVTN family beta-propeller protein